MNTPTSGGQFLRTGELYKFVIALFIVVIWPASRVIAGTVQPIYNFQSASSPSSLIQGFDGAFYGTTLNGGSNSYGSVFRFTTNGNITLLASFAVTNGSNPGYSVVQGPDGMLYGTTENGGANSDGTVFRITTNGVLTTLVSFTGTGGPYQGRYPRSLSLGRDGKIYGTTYYGGASSRGTVFCITTNGGFVSLVSFYGTDGGLSEGVVQGVDGILYGSASGCGPKGYGTVYRVTTNGVWSTVAYFNNTNGCQPSSRLMQASDGNLYGTAYFGGAYNNGTVFRCTTGGVLTDLSDFYTADYSQSCLTEVNGDLYGTSRGTAYPYSGVIFEVLPNGSRYAVFSFSSANSSGPCDQLTLASDGNLYGTTYGGGTPDAGTVFQYNITQGIETRLAAFPANSGQDPEGGLVQGVEGNLYGTTYSGGDFGLGTVFSIAVDGTVCSRTSFNGTNGANPTGSLVRGQDGKYYGTTFRGGSLNEGALFCVTTNGALISLASFTGTNGTYPNGSLVQGGDGAFYGTTGGGGNNSAGAIFRFTPAGSLNLLASLDGTHGSWPQAGVVFGKDGALYGTASEGGGQGAGTVFRVTTNGTLTLVASFDAADGWGMSPRSPLLLAKDGTFFGTTDFTSNNNTGYGTVYHVTANGLLTNMYCFQSMPSPSYPTGPLAQGTDGALYGSTISGGSMGYGSLYRLDMDGTLTTLVSFDNSTGGADPMAGVIQAGDNYFYGTASFAGSYGSGNVFRVALISQMKPPVNARRVPKVTVTREGVALCQKGVTRWPLFLVNSLLAPKRVKTSRGASFEP